MLDELCEFIFGVYLCLTGAKAGAFMAYLFPYDRPPISEMMKPLVEKYLNMSSYVPFFVALSTFDPQQES